jgi:hypothetical protein
MTLSPLERDFLSLLIGAIVILAAWMGWAA